ncbi:hypothetical protein BDN72DRAFT_478369 [Pluteus cervinus]|uniref:Uncharacterized protein n=1 Tax=Pluteus cervinus TaxID=181527 RepID=A0ACD3A5E3_9AGAR|nr:hypothetical protein BDN72DRAFT_478369 [Pluteus cervinus]
MEEPTAEDEKKPFDAENGQDEDAQPDPDEQLMLDQGSGRVWLVKIPKNLMERWASVDAEGRHLATVRVYTNTDNANRKPRIILFLPPFRDANYNPNGETPPPPIQKPNWPAFDPSASIYSTETEPDCYELEMVNDSVENQIVVAERPKDPSFNPSQDPQDAVQAQMNSRARTTILTGRIKHECNLKPGWSKTYRKQMRERHLKYNTPKRQIRRIEDGGIPGGRGGINRLSSGVGVGASSAFGDLIKTKPKQPKGTFERMARMPRNQLLDLIFQLFREPARWNIRALRERTQQPEAYLKEVLSEVAFLHRSGEHNGLWELRDDYKGEGVKGENIALPEGSQDIKMEGDEQEEDDEDDDEDEDMEEIS